MKQYGMRYALMGFVVLLGASGSVKGMDELVDVLTQELPTIMGRPTTLIRTAVDNAALCIKNEKDQLTTANAGLVKANADLQGTSGNARFNGVAIALMSGALAWKAYDPKNFNEAFNGDIHNIAKTLRIPGAAQTAIHLKQGAMNSVAEMQMNLLLAEKLGRGLPTTTLALGVTRAAAKALLPEVWAVRAEALVTGGTMIFTGPADVASMKWESGVGVASGALMNTVTESAWFQSGLNLAVNKVMPSKSEERKQQVVQGIKIAVYSLGQWGVQSIASMAVGKHTGNTGMSK